jgi:hypothetical protein
MVFNEADKGGKAGGGAAVLDVPAEPKPSGVSPTDVFKQARVDAGLDKPAEPPVVDPPPTVDPPVVDDRNKPAAPPAKKSVVPDDVIDPNKATPPKVHAAVAEIQEAELPKGAKKEQVDSFAKLKTKAAAHLQAALDRAADLEKQAAAATNKDEVAALQKRAQEAEDRAKQIAEDFEKVNFEQSPKFKAQFADQEKTALDLAKSYLDGTEIKPDIIDLAAHATGRKRLEILKGAGIEDSSISALLPHLANYDTIQRNKQATLANWKNESKQWQQEAQQRSEKAKAARLEQENKVWEQVISSVDLLPLRKSKDNPEWNGRGEQIVAESKKIFNGDGTDLPTFAETILKGRAYDAQQEVVDHLKGQVASLREENAKLKSAAPGGSIGAGTQDGAPVDTTKMSRDDVAKSTFNSEKAKAAAA